MLSEPPSSQPLQSIPLSDTSADQQNAAKLSMGLEEMYDKPEARQGDKVARYTSLAGAAILCSATWVIVLTNAPTSAGWFALHPLLQTLSILLFTYGIITLQPTSQPRTKAAGLTRHQTAILFIAFPSILLGTTAVTYNKWLRRADHLVTSHGQLGFLCILWLVVQLGLGAGSVWFHGAMFGGGMKAKAIWKYHRLSGYLLFSLLLLTAHLGGGWSNWGAKHTSWGTRLIYYTFAPLAVFSGVFIRIRLSKMKFL